MHQMVQIYNLKGAMSRGRVIFSNTFRNGWLWLKGRVADYTITGVTPITLITVITVITPITLITLITQLHDYRGVHPL